MNEKSKRKTEGERIKKREKANVRDGWERERENCNSKREKNSTDTKID